LEESHLIAYATAIKQTIIPERKLENVEKSGLLSKTPVMKLLLKRLHAACLLPRRMGKWALSHIGPTPLR
jgi:hypothetical protein